jgi:hypothetical protein
MLLFEQRLNAALVDEGYAPLQCEFNCHPSLRALIFEKQSVKRAINTKIHPEHKRPITGERKL